MESVPVLQKILDRIYASKNLNEVLIDLHAQMPDLLPAGRLAIHLVNITTRQLYSRFKIDGEICEVRLPISDTSIAGYVAETGRRVGIRNAYDEKEVGAVCPGLRFDTTLDTRSGYRTTQLLAVPMRFHSLILGVLQLHNTVNGSDFTTEDEESAQRVADALGRALYEQHRSSLFDRRSSIERRVSSDPQYSGPDRRSGRDRRSTRDRRKTARGTFDYLLEKNLITEKGLRQAEIKARGMDTSVEQVLMRNHQIRQEDLGLALSHFYTTRFIPFDANIPIPGELLDGLKQSFLRYSLWVPVGKDNGYITVLTTNPHDLNVRSMVHRLLKTDKIEFCVGLKEDILKFLDYFYGPSEPQPGDEIVGGKGDEEPETELELVPETDNLIVNFVNRMIVDACNKRASDIHFESNSERFGSEVRFRIDGTCVSYQTVSYKYKRAVVNRLKIMANLDIAERRLPQDGKIQYRKSDGKRIELRVTTLPLATGVEDVVLRILTPAEPIPMEKVGFTQANLDTFKRLIDMPYGLVLVVGPTGSGKTTTLHAALGHINRPERKIVTVEDPVEITQPRLRQVQVKPEIDLTFASVMRAFLRCDPDVIMVGEMRDRETAHIAIQASLTGHLVLSTLHTNSAPETVTRLLDLGVDCFNFADALLGIVAQRLVRTLCKDCRQPFHPSEKEFQDLVEEHGEEDFRKLNIAYSPDLVLYQTKGCIKCNNTGYYGRTAIHELLVGTEEIKQLIQLRRLTWEIRDQAKKNGMLTLKQDGIRKVLDGVTNILEVRKACIK